MRVVKVARGERGEVATPGEEDLAIKCFAFELDCRVTISFVDLGICERKLALTLCYNIMLESVLNYHKAGKTFLR